jgi:hypothetical protein
VQIQPLHQLRPHRTDINVLKGIEADQQIILDWRWRSRPLRPGLQRGETGLRDCVDEFVGAATLNDFMDVNVPSLLQAT